MIQNNHLLLAPSRLKRMLIYAILRLSGNYKEMHGLLVNFEEIRHVRTAQRSCISCTLWPRAGQLC